MPELPAENTAPSIGVTQGRPAVLGKLVTIPRRAWITDPRANSMELRQPPEGR